MATTFALAVLAAIPCASSQAGTVAVAPRWSLETDGGVGAFATSDTTTYFGGSFDYVGSYTGSGVVVDARSGELDSRFPTVAGFVTAVAPDGSGGWFLGGCFETVGGLRRHGLAHVLLDGSIDADWAPMVAAEEDSHCAEIQAITVAGGVVYVGGSFATVDGVRRSMLAALDAESGAVTSWNPDPSRGFSVAAIAVSGSRVYVGGDFGRIGGKPRAGLAAIDAATGAATDWDPRPDGYSVDAIAVAGSTVYIGGDFERVGGKARAGLAALDAATGVATAWNPRPDGDWVTALAVAGSTVYAGGDFGHVGREARAGLAAVDAATGIATEWDPKLGSADLYDGVDVHAIAVSGSTVYVGGDFKRAGSQPRLRAAGFDRVSGSLTRWDPRVNSWVDALAVSDTSVFLGGSFSSAGGVLRDSLAAVDNETGAVRDWHPGVGHGRVGGVTALELQGDTLYVGGTFSAVGGASRRNIAAVDAVSSAVTAWNPSVRGLEVGAIAASESLVYIGGDFSMVGGQSRRSLAALNAVTGAPTAWNPRPTSRFGAEIRAIAISGHRVYVGGYFTAVGGRRRLHLAALDARTGKATRWRANANGHVLALAVAGSTIYATGDFTRIGKTSRRYVAAVDQTDGAVTSWDPRVTVDDDVHCFHDGCFVSSIAVAGNTVYFGGHFQRVGGQLRHDLAAVDASTGVVTDWLPDTRCGFARVAATTTTVHVGGPCSLVQAFPLHAPLVR